MASDDTTAARQTLKLFLVRDAKKAVKISTFDGGQGGDQMRLDIERDTLPAIEWSAALIGQRARVLVGEHKWVEAIVTEFAASMHTLLLADGKTTQHALPDHRVALQLETAHEAVEGEGGAAAEGKCPAGHTLGQQVGAEKGVHCDGCGIALGRMGTTFFCRKCDYDLCAACSGSSGGSGGGDAKTAPAGRPYLSTLSSTGFRHVRPTTSVPGAGASFEAAFYVAGKAKILEACPTAEEAAERYRAFAAEQLSRGRVGGGSAAAASGATPTRGGGQSGASGAKKGADKRDDKRDDKATKGKAAAAVEYGPGLVGRVVRVFDGASGEWRDGVLTQAVGSMRGRAKFGMRFLGGDGKVCASSEGIDAALLRAHADPPVCRPLPTAFCRMRLM